MGCFRMRGAGFDVGKSSRIEYMEMPVPRKKTPRDVFLHEPNTSLLVLYHPEKRQLLGLGSKGSLWGDGYVIYGCRIGRVPDIHALMNEEDRHSRLRSALFNEGFQPFVLVPDAVPIPFLEGFFSANVVCLQEIMVWLFSGLLNVRLNNRKSLVAYKQRFDDESVSTATIASFAPALAFSPLAQEVLQMAQNWFPIEPVIGLSGGSRAYF